MALRCARGAAAGAGPWLWGPRWCRHILPAAPCLRACCQVAEAQVIAAKGRSGLPNGPSGTVKRPFLQPVTARVARPFGRRRHGIPVLSCFVTTAGASPRGVATVASAPFRGCWKIFAAEQILFHFIAVCRYFAYICIFKSI